jgi:hypothetical protein
MSRAAEHAIALLYQMEQDKARDHEMHVRVRKAGRPKYTQTGE